MIGSAHITVRNIGGDVTLTGTVPSYPQYLAAAAAARRVAGVTGVHNHLEVVLPEGDYRDDAKLATAANNALAQNVTVPDTVEDGNISLTGTVSYGTERAAAEAVVTGVVGVRNVINDIEISYVIDPVDVDLHVQEALDRSALVPDGSDVTANTNDGIITLTGIAAARRSAALRISAATTIDRATAAQIIHCRTSSRTVFITVWKMPRTVDRTSRTKDPLVVMRNVLSEKVSRENAESRSSLDSIEKNRMNSARVPVPGGGRVDAALGGQHDQRALGRVADQLTVPDHRVRGQHHRHQELIQADLRLPPTRVIRPAVE